MPEEDCIPCFSSLSIVSEAAEVPSPRRQRRLTQARTYAARRHHEAHLQERCDQDTVEGLRHCIELLNQEAQQLAQALCVCYANHLEDFEAMSCLLSVPASVWEAAKQHF